MKEGCCFDDCKHVMQDEMWDTLESLKDRGLRVMVLLGIIGKMQRVQADRELEKLGLTSVQMEVLMYLLKREHEGCGVTARELERRFRVSNPTMSGILKRLEKKGMIERTASEKDKRNKQIKIRVDVFDIRSEMIKKLMDGKGVFFGNFTEEELVGMEKFLLKLLHNLDQKRNEE